MQNFTAKHLTAVSLALALGAFGAQAACAQETSTEQTAASSESVSAAPVEPAAPAEAAPVEAEPAPAPQAPAVAQLNPIPAPPAGKGQVVFFRPSRMVGAAISVSVHEGGKGICKLTNGSYCIYVAEPGTTEYMVSLEATDSLRMEIEEGETYYVIEAMAMGVLAARPNLTPSTEAAFQAKKLKVSKAKPTDVK